MKKKPHGRRRRNIWRYILRAMLTIIILLGITSAFLAFLIIGYGQEADYQQARYREHQERIYVNDHMD